MRRAAVTLGLPRSDAVRRLRRKRPGSAQRCLRNHDATPEAHRRDVITLYGFMRRRSADAKQRRRLLDGVDEPLFDGNDDTCRRPGCRRIEIARGGAARRLASSCWLAARVRKSDVQDIVDRRCTTAWVHRGPDTHDVARSCASCARSRPSADQSAVTYAVLGHFFDSSFFLAGAVSTRPMMSAAARSRSSMAWL